MAIRKFISEDNLLYYHAGIKKLFATQAGLTALSNVVNGKADAATTLAGYGITDAMTATAITQAISDAISGKADASTTLSGYGITDAYTKTQVDNLINALDTGVVSVNGKTGEVTLTLADLGAASASDLQDLSERVDDIVSTGGEPNRIDTVKVNGTALPITNKAIDVTVPTKTSDITNDSGFQTASDVSTAISGKADKSTTLSGYGITNAYTKTEADGKFITEHQDITGKADKATTLAGYGIADAMTETEINQAIADAIGDVTSFEFQIVQTLPASGEKGTMYLMLMGTTETQNYYEEFIYVNNAWEKLGTLGVDLSGYMKTADMVEATETEIDTILAS